MSTMLAPNPSLDPVMQLHAAPAPIVLHYVPKVAIMAAIVDDTPSVALCGSIGIWSHSADSGGVRGSGRGTRVCSTCRVVYSTLAEGAGK